MAPEQVFGAAPHPASDVYAFGILLFEMLTGQLPFRSAGGSGATLLQRLHQVAPAPSSLVAPLPEGWDQLVQHCLKLQPGERYQDAGEVLAAFDGLWLDAPAPLSARRRLDPLPEAASGLGLAATLATTRLSDGRRRRGQQASSGSKAHGLQEI